MNCARRGCSSTDAERFAPGIYLCLFHRSVILGASREHEQRARVDRKKRDADAHQVAVQAAGWVSPPPVKKVTTFAVFSGGLPSLGKGQR